MPKYRITKSRYIDGRVVAATVESPAIIELPEGCKVDRGLEPLGDGPPPAMDVPKPHYASRAERPDKRPDRSDRSDKKEDKKASEKKPDVL